MHPLGRAIVHGQPFLAALVIAAGYWLGTQIGFLLTPTGLPVSMLWPPNAMLLGALLITPRSWWPLCLLAVVPVHLGTQLSREVPVATSIGWLMTNTSEAVLAAVWLQRLRTPRELFQTFAGVVIFLIVAVIGVTGVMSLLDAAVVVGTGASRDYWLICRQRFASNALATLTLVPAIVMIGTSSLTHLRTIPGTRYLEGSLLAIATLAIVRLLSAWYGHGLRGTLALAYSLLPVLFWAAVRFGPLGISLLLVMTASAILWTAVNVGRMSLAEVLSLQMLLAVLSGLSLTLAVVVFERRRLQQFHSAVLTSMRDGVAITDADGVVIDANPSWTADAHARSPGRLDGVPVRTDYFGDRWTDPSPDARRMLNGLNTVLAGSQAHFEMEYSLHDTDAPRWFSISVVPLQGPQHGAVITQHDITERKRSEAVTQQLRDELAQAGRVMTMGMLSASLTHELSQPLAAILANAQVARRLCERKGDAATTEIQEIVGDIIDSSRRAGGILRQLRQVFVAGSSNPREPVSLNDIVQDVLHLMGSDLVRDGISVLSRLAPALPCVPGDRVQFRQLVLNLIVNAGESMRDNAPGDRQITLTTSAIDAGVLLQIEDVGTGIEPARLGSIFDPFFTTKREGLGLGLALCRWIVLAHAGQLRAENNTGRGATMHCLLPFAPAGQAGRPPATASIE
jgi:C4-dicarboxylate-specific signal transduction histidine kinase